MHAYIHIYIYIYIYTHMHRYTCAAEVELAHECPHRQHHSLDDIGDNRVRPFV